MQRSEKHEFGSWSHDSNEDGILNQGNARMVAGYPCLGRNVFWLADIKERIALAHDLS